MRSSPVAFSSMPTGKAYIGWWGDMGGPVQKGIKTYSVSNFQQRAFKGVIHGYVFNGFRRITAQAPYFFVPLAAGYATYVWANKTDAYNNSKAGHVAHGGSGH